MGGLRVMEMVLFHGMIQDRQSMYNYLIGSPQGKRRIGRREHDRGNNLATLDKHLGYFILVA